MNVQDCSHRKFNGTAEWYKAGRGNWSKMITVKKIGKSHGQCNGYRHGMVQGNSNGHGQKSCFCCQYLILISFFSMALT
jgi:hypothetical protein